MTEEVKIAPIHPEFVDAVWAKVVELMGPSIATSRGKFTPEDVRAEIMGGELVLWMIWRGTAPAAFYTTRIVSYPGGRGLAMDWVGGSGVFSWLDALVEATETHARRNGCTHLEGFGRRAWGRLLERHGWEPEYIAYRKDLTDG